MSATARSGRFLECRYGAQVAVAERAIAAPCRKEASAGVRHIGRPDEVRQHRLDVPHRVQRSDLISLLHELPPRKTAYAFDLGQGRRRWRALDLGTTPAFVEADAPRVRCRRHGVVVCAVPWARHNARFTRAFDDQTAWLALKCPKTAVAQ